MQTQALDVDDKPGFSFTTGFQASIGHPEVICFKIDRKVANEIFWVLYRCAQSGNPVPRAVRTGGILPMTTLTFSRSAGDITLITSGGAAGSTAAMISNASRSSGLMRRGSSRGKTASTADTPPL